MSTFAKTYLEKTVKNKDTFWKIEVSGTSTIIVNGEVGNESSHKTAEKKHKSKKEAVAHAQKVRDQKLKAGFLKATEKKKNTLPAKKQKQQPAKKEPAASKAKKQTKKPTKKELQKMQEEEEEEQEEEQEPEPTKKQKTNKKTAKVTNVTKKESKKNVTKKQSKANVAKKESKKNVAKKKSAPLQRSFVVDRHVPENGSWEIYKNYAVKLNQANIDNGNNNNKFYIIQLLEKGGKYACWNRWGRIGEDGQHALKQIGSLEAAIKDFEKKFYDKTHNKYSIRGTGASEWSKFSKVKGKYTIVETEDVQGGEDNDNPMGKLTETQIEKGQEVLKSLNPLVKTSNKKNSEKIALLSSEFYSLIPTQSGRQRLPPINTLNLVEEKEELLKFFLRMGFQDISSQDKASPIEGLMDVKLPKSLLESVNLGKICSKYDSDDSNDKAEDYFNDQVGNPVKKMAQALYASILLYTSNAIYRDLNQSLREENHAKIKKYYPFLRLFFEALDHLPKQKKTVWRGVSVDLQKDYTVGKEITWWGVSSCTTNESVARGFASSCGNATLLTIECQNASDISDITHYPHEKENLLPPGTKLKVLSSKKNGNMTEIRMKEVDQLARK